MEPEKGSRRKSWRWIRGYPPSILALLSLAFTLNSCSLIDRAATRYAAADLAEIYDDSSADSDLNPLILIHGFAGSTLVRSSDGAIAWGAFFTEDSMLPSRLHGLQAIALDIGALPTPLEHTDLVEIPDDAHAGALLEFLQADAKVVNLNFEVYSALVQMVERVGYGPCVSDPEDLDAPIASGPECFTFFYDWRQDNVGNAIQLGKFIEQAKQEVQSRRGRVDVASNPGVKFDVIAHSMGGLLARYYLRFGAHDVLGEPNPPITWAGAENLARLVLISTPNFGAMRVLKEAMTGRRYPVVKFEPAMISTWVSVYQMFPRQNHRLWFDKSGYPTEIAIADASAWRQNRWGGFAPDQDEYLQWIFPDTTSLIQRQNRLEDFMRVALDRADRLTRALDKHPQSQSPVPMILFAADAEPTLARAVVADRKGTLRLKFGVKKPDLKSPGDGSVTRASALADERLATGQSSPYSSPVHWSQTIFLADRHRTLLGNPTFQNNLLQILLQSEPQPEP